MTDATRSPADEVATMLARCVQGDGVALRRLYDLQSPLLYSVALRITGKPALASDAVHDTLLQVWRNVARFDPAQGSARAWLLAMVRQRAIDSIARVGRPLPDPTAEAPAAADPIPLDRLLTSREGQALHRCLQQVEPEQRNLVVLAYVDGLSHTEVAERTGQAPGAVQASIRRTLATMRSCLGGVA